MAEQDSKLSGNPAFQIAALGVGAAALIAVVIALTEPVAGPAVGSVEEAEITEMDDEVPAPEVLAEDGGDAEAMTDEADAGSADDVDVAEDVTEPEDANLPVAPVEEASSEAVTPDDNADIVTPVAGNDTDAESGEAAAEAGDGTTADDIDLVVDPDSGGGDGVEPDGGADPFFPTPSGPEGADGDPLTTD